MAYLFVHFIGEQKDGEQIYFSVSKDGLHWQDLNGYRPVLYSGIGEKGVRDPFCVRDEKNGKFYLIATDLRIEAGKGWDKAVHEGSRDLIVWESEDLVNWSKERAVTVAVPGAGCAWAPETVYDPEREAFFVFWASHVKGEGDAAGKHRIFGSYTKDFKTFSPAEKYLEKDCDVIDTTMIFAEGMWYRFSKDETTKRICMERSASLHGSFEEVKSALLDGLYGVEGPEIYRLPDGRYCLIVDQFAAGKGYLPLVTDKLAGGEFTELSAADYDLGVLKKRHGGVMEITDAEYERLVKAFGRTNPVLPGLFADPDIAVFDGKYYIYPTTDGFDGWGGWQFFVFSSEDGRHFRKGPMIVDVASDQVPWSVSHAWAPCIAHRGDTWYFYFCAKDRTGTSCIGMASAKSPEGPFTACPQPLVTMPLMKELGIRMGQTIDPSIYQEGEDFYLLFGNSDPAIGKLKDTMDGFVPGTVKNLEGLYDFREAVTVLRRGGLYHFTWSCDDTGSENYHINYGTSESLYGPVTYRYPILEKDPDRDIYGTGHHSITRLPGQDAYVIAYHRFGTPTDRYPEGKGYHRETCIAPLCFGEDGLMKRVEMED
ncbi:MAG: family 43 glycosylhydrolase [Eubacteriales bacterium]|nr:family 43 glycosylhydrolase [Eubacteriales bacterium]